MGENGSPPLSRRVPGTTSMPRARVRRSPPRLPDEVLERLKAEVQAARAREAEEPDLRDTWHSDEASSPEPSREAVPRGSKLNGSPQRPNAEPRPEEPAVEPSPQEPKAAPLPVRSKADPFSQHPRVAPRIERPKLAPLRPEPEVAPPAGRPNVAPLRQRPSVPPLWPMKSDEQDEPEQPEWQVVPDLPESPVADSNDRTEPIPVVAPSGSSPPDIPIRQLITDQAPPTAPERPRRETRSSRHRYEVAGPQVSKRPASQPAKPAARHLPKPAPQRPKLVTSGRSKLTSPRSAAGYQATGLQALFAETTDFEEVVASARAQASRIAGVEWRHVFAAAVLAALILVAVVVFMVELVG
jgi:hypothetical protein